MSPVYDQQMFVTMEPSLWPWEVNIYRSIFSIQIKVSTFPSPPPTAPTVCVFMENIPTVHQNNGVVSPRMEARQKARKKISAIYYLLLRFPESKRRFTPTLLPYQTSIKCVLPVWTSLSLQLFIEHLHF